MDEAKVVHDAFDCKVESLIGFFKPQVWWSFAVATLEGLKPKPPDGDMYQLGATFVMDTSTARKKNPMWFVHRQQRWGDHPNGQQVLEAVIRARGAAESGESVRTVMRYSADMWVATRVNFKAKARDRRELELELELKREEGSVRGLGWMAVVALVAAVLGYLRSRKREWM